MSSCYIFPFSLAHDVKTVRVGPQNCFLRGINFLGLSVICLHISKPHLVSLYNAMRSFAVSSNLFYTVLAVSLTFMLAWLRRRIKPPTQAKVGIFPQFLGCLVSFEQRPDQKAETIQAIKPTAGDTLHH